MDDATKRAYIQARITKAEEDLTTARDNLIHKHWRGAVNRAYYAAFHITSAVLLWHNVERARHAGVQAALGEFLIKPGLIEPEFGQIYSKVRKIREAEDYEVLSVPLTGEEATRIVDETDQFVSRLKSYLHQVQAI